MTKLKTGTTTNNIETTVLMKSTINKFGKHFLLGLKDGEKIYLERPSFDCSWYWGFGYLHTFTNNRAPELSRDISSHTHFDTTFKSYENIFTGKEKSLLDKTVLNDRETWQLYELMKTAYNARNYSDMLHKHGAHITKNVCADYIGNDAEYKRINNDLLPRVFKEIELILSPDAEKSNISEYWEKIIEKGVI